jgi:hypothetical protein
MPTSTTADPEARRRHEALRTALEDEGFPMRDAARAANLRLTWAYTLAKRYNWPLNKPVKPGAQRERQILAALAAGYDRWTVGRMYSQALININRIQARVRDQTRESAA